MGVAPGVQLPVALASEEEEGEEEEEFRLAAQPPSSAPLRPAVCPEKMTVSVGTTKTSTAMTALSMMVRKGQNET